MGFEGFVFVSKRLQVVALAGICLVAGQVLHHIKAASAQKGGHPLGVWTEGSAQAQSKTGVGQTGGVGPYATQKRTGSVRVPVRHD